MPALTPAQEEEYAEQGYLLVSGLIAPEIALAAETAMWNALGADPNDTATWEQASRQQAATFHEPALVACYTPQMLAAAARLAGDDPALFLPPTSAYALNVFPQPGPWQWLSPHIDHAIKEHGHKTFPRAFRIAAMTFLSDVAPQGGGTVVWPGSHKRIEALARSDLGHYEMMWVLGQDIQKAGLGDPVELTPRRGEVLFYHYLCAHSGSQNTSSRPRLALNKKW